MRTDTRVLHWVLEMRCPVPPAILLRCWLELPGTAYFYVCSVSMTISMYTILGFNLKITRTYQKSTIISFIILSEKISRWLSRKQRKPLPCREVHTCALFHLSFAYPLLTKTDAIQHCIINLTYHNLLFYHVCEEARLVWVGFYMWF